MQQVSKTRVFCSATKYDAFSFFSPSFDYLLIVWGRLLCWQYNRDVIREMETQIQYSRASVPLKATTEPSDFATYSDCKPATDCQEVFC